MFKQIEEGAEQIDKAIQGLSDVQKDLFAFTEEVVQAVECISAGTEEMSASTEEISSLTENQTLEVRNIVKMTRKLAAAGEDLQNLALNFTP